MTKFKVYVTRMLPGPALAKLQQKCDTVVNNEERPPSRQEILHGVKDADGLLCLLTDKISASVIRSAPKLKVISNYAVGFDNVDAKAATRRKIIVTNTPGVLTQAVAEHTFALLMAAARRIAESDRFARKGKYKAWSPTLFLGSELKGKTLGVVGLGRIGSIVANIAKNGYGMNVIYYSEHRDTEAEAQGIKYINFDELLVWSDFVSIHVPLTEKTHHLIGDAQFAKMKRTAYLINTARGPIVDEHALIKALKEQRIAGAAIDVFEHEPKIHPELRKLNNITITPHTASATNEAREAMATLAVDNLLDVLEGRTPKAIVNPEVFGKK